MKFIGRIVVVIYLFPFTIFSQTPSDSISSIVYLTGNTAEAADMNFARALHAILLAENGKQQTLIFNGDILHKYGIDKIATAEDTLFIKGLLDITKNISNVKTYFTPGDLDWNNSGKDGLEGVKHLENLINGLAGQKIFLPGSGCPGPEMVDLGESLRMIIINSPWWIHPHDKPHAPDTDCDILVEAQFIEELEELLEERGNKNILLVGHHPVLSDGKYGGRSAFTDHLAPPIFGSFNVAYHKNIGTARDFSFPAYQSFIRELKYLMQDYAPFIYASAHDYDLQALEYENSYQLVSGSIANQRGVGKSKNTVYRSKEAGFIKLSYYKNGKVMCGFYKITNDSTSLLHTSELYQSACDHDNSGAPTNTSFIPCRKQIEPAGKMNPSFYDSIGTAIGGPEYKAGFFGRLFLGSLYRTSWTAPVRVPYLNLDTTKGGLKAVGKGGGRQTHSLSLQGADGKSYVFRSVDKDPVKALDPLLRRTILVELTRQSTATQHPYGALPVQNLLDNTSILHAEPALFILPDDPKLGMFQSEFGNMLGMLEEKASKAGDGRTGSYDADYVVRSFDLFRKLYKDHDNNVDEISFARARLFDIWIGDWGRHEDNWKWAGFKHKGKTVFYPIPRDRDHAFSRWNGLLPWLADRRWARPNVENFDDKFHDLKSATWPSRHLDRFLLSSVNKDQWMGLVGELQKIMTDAVIDTAIQHFPETVIPLSGNEIASKLKLRRSDLTNGLEKYYSLLSKNVDIAGSNKKELFQVNSLKDGQLQVLMFEKTKSEVNLSDTLFKRTFYHDETKHVNIYGLDGDDEFRIKGEHDNEIKVRIVSGKGDDIVNNETPAGHGKSFLTLYDNSDSLFITNAADKRKITENPEWNDYDRQAFQYNTYLPLPVLSYSSDDGFTVGLGCTFTFHKWGEDEYASKLSVGGRISTLGNVQVRLRNELHHAIGKWDWIVDGEWAMPYPFNYFYGLGNETVRDENQSISYYRSRHDGINATTGLQRVFLRKSVFALNVFYENNESQIIEDTYLEDFPGLLGVGKINFVGGDVRLDLDFRDSKYFPKRGARFFASQSYNVITNLDKHDFANSEVSLEAYFTSESLLPLTLGIKGGANRVSGEVPFYEYNTLGRTTHLRGFQRDRFAGNSTAYLNNQLTLSFGTVQTVVAPLSLGLFGFYDLGKVWEDDVISDKIHSGYGGGIYITPIYTQYTTFFSVAFSEEESGLFEFGLGLRF